MAVPDTVRVRLCERYRGRRESPQNPLDRAKWFHFEAVPAVPAVGDVEPIAPCRSDCRQFWSLIGGKPY
ncbi:hypothetical protein QUB30_07905 [Microcoleus sp. BROC3]